MGRPWKYYDSASQEACTTWLCFSIVQFTHIFQCCLTDVIIWLSQSQWSDSEDYGQSNHQVDLPGTDNITVLKLRTICRARGLWKLTQSCKQLCLLCLSDLWNLPVLPYSVDSKAPRVLWNPMRQAVFSEYSFISNDRIMIKFKSNLYVRPVIFFIILTLQYWHNKTIYNKTMCIFYETYSIFI